MAGHVLAAERIEMVKLADDRGVFIVGVRKEAEGAEPQVAARTRNEFVSLGSVPAATGASGDMARAVGILSALSEFGTGSAAVIDGGRVIAVGAGEPAVDVIGRVASLRGSNRLRKGIAAIGRDQRSGEALVRAANDVNLIGIVIANDSFADKESVVQLADELNVFVAQDKARTMAPETGSRPLKIFLVAGEHSGDALGAKLINALKKRRADSISFAGVGGEEMVHEGFRSLFPIEDVAVMGPMSILPRLPRIMRRVYQTVDAAIAFAPDVVVIIDSPEFTHPIAKRIRKRAPEIPIVDYVSPSVWAWRPGRAKKMRPYVDHILALLPFEPEAHARLGGPPCTYVGHPLIEKLGEIENADGAGLASRLGLAPDRPVLLVLPGSRTSEVDRLIDVFGETVARVSSSEGPIEVVIPAVKHVRDRIVAKTAAWTPRPHIVDASTNDKYAAMRLARAALAASGTVTLELALAQTPSVIAYKVDMVMANLRFLLKVPSIVLANLVIGRNVYPEYLQEACNAENLAAALEQLFSDTDARKAQLEGLALAPAKTPPRRLEPKRGGGRRRSFGCRGRSGGREITPRLTDIELPRAADALLRILDHFLPLRDPADGARDREEHSEHVDREAHRAKRDARIEVDVRIELLFDEVLVLQSDPLKFNRDLEQRIVLVAERVEHLVTGLLHHLRARIVVLVDAMAEAHQPEAGCLVLGLLHVFRNAVDRPDLLQHVERRFVGAAVRGPPEAGDTGRDACERIGAGRSRKAHRRRRGILLVVGVQDEDAVERARDDRVDDVGLARNREAHLQEVRRVIEIVAWIDERLPDRIFVGHCRDRRHLGDHALACDLALRRIVDVGGVMVKRRQRADCADHYGHRVRVTPVAGEEPRHLLMNHRVVRDRLPEIDEFSVRRQLAVKEQVADGEEIGVLGKLIDRVAAIKQFAFIAVDIGDRAFAVRRRCETGIVGEAARLFVEIADVDNVRPDDAGANRKLNLLIVYRQCCAGLRSALGRFVVDVHDCHLAPEDITDA